MKKETIPQQLKDYIENSIESKNMTNLENTKDYGVIHLAQLLVVEEVESVEGVEHSAGDDGEVAVRVQQELVEPGDGLLLIEEQFHHVGQRFLPVSSLDAM